MRRSLPRNQYLNGDREKPSKARQLIKLKKRLQSGQRVLPLIVLCCSCIQPSDIANSCPSLPGEIAKPSFVFYDPTQSMIDPMHAYHPEEDADYFFFASQRRDRQYEQDLADYGWPNHMAISYLRVAPQEGSVSEALTDVIVPEPSEFRYWAETSNDHKRGYGTGSIIRKDGTWFMFLANSRVGMASSRDLRSWVKWDADGDSKPDFVWDGESIPESLGIDPAPRYLDPFVYWDERAQRYHMIYIAIDSRTGDYTLAHNVSQDLISWQSRGRLELPAIFDDKSPPEVPQLFLQNGRYYLFVSYFQLSEAGSRLLGATVDTDRDALDRGELVMIADKLEGPYRLTPCSRFLKTERIRYASRIYQRDQGWYMTSMINGTPYDARALPRPLQVQFLSNGVGIEGAALYDQLTQYR